MNIDYDDLRQYAFRIWRHGESQQTANFCFIPSDFDGNDDAVINKYDVTHFDVFWDEPGKSIRVNLYRGDAFGACADPELIGTVVGPA